MKPMQFLSSRESIDFNNTHWRKKLDDHFPYAISIYPEEYREFPGKLFNNQCEKIGKVLAEAFMSMTFASNSITNPKTLVIEDVLNAIKGERNTDFNFRHNPFFEAIMLAYHPHSADGYIASNIHIMRVTQEEKRVTLILALRVAVHNGNFKAYNQLKNAYNDSNLSWGMSDNTFRNMGLHRTECLKIAIANGQLAMANHFIASVRKHEQQNADKVLRNVLGELFYPGIQLPEISRDYLNNLEDVAGVKLLPQPQEEKANRNYKRKLK